MNLVGISLSFKNDAQYVKLDGALSTVEEAAVRLKLDQKINQGRSKILIDISSFAIDDKESVKALHTVLRFTLQRGTTLSLFGLKNTLWIKIAENFPGKVQMHETEAEALKWIEANAKKPEAPVGEIKKPDPEDEIKQKLLAEVLAKYEIYQAQNDYDPYLLKKLERDYAQAPQREAIFALRRAYKHVFTLKEGLSALEDRCREIADQLLESMKIRKIPLSPAELSAKRKSIQDMRAAVQADLDEVKAEVDANMATAVEFRKKSSAHEDRWKVELDLLQRQIETQTVENKKLHSQLSSQS
jgi:hypothetical protein